MEQAAAAASEGGEVDQLKNGPELAVVLNPVAAPRSAPQVTKSTEDAGWALVGRCVVIGGACVLVYKVMDALLGYLGLPGLYLWLADHLLKVLSYFFMVVMSYLCVHEVRRVFRQSNKPAHARVCVIALLIGVMISFAIVAAHQQFGSVMANAGGIALVGAALAGGSLGWVLPCVAHRAAFGVPVYVGFLTVLFAFSWLARLASVDAYLCIAFATLLAFLLKTAVSIVQGQLRDEGA